MLQNYVAGELSSLLGAYIENVSASQLRLGIWNGRASLEGLRFRHDALDSLRLPFRLVDGVISRLDVIVPWTRLAKEPVVISVQGVSLLLETDVNITPEEAAIHAKQAILKASERQSRRKRRQSMDESFSDRLMGTVLDNLSVSMSRVHIRVRIREDDPSQSSPSLTPCFSLWLEKVTAESCDEHDQSYFTSASDSFLYKRMLFQGLSVHWNPDYPTPQPLQQADESRDDHGEHELSSTHELSEMRQVFDAASTLSSFSESSSHLSDATASLAAQEDAIAAVKTSWSCILTPLNTRIQFRLSRIEFEQSSEQVPKVSLGIQLPLVQVRLSPAMIRDVSVVSSMFGAPEQSNSDLGVVDTEKRTAALKKPVDLVKGSPSRWWRYAIRRVIAEKIRTSVPWRWTHIASFRRDLFAYKQLWKTCLGQHRVVENDGREMGDEDVDVSPENESQASARWKIEQRWSLRQILLMRSIAEHELTAEEARAEVRRHRKQKHNRRGWRGYLRRWITETRAPDDRSEFDIGKYNNNAAARSSSSDTSSQQNGATTDSHPPLRRSTADEGGDSDTEEVFSALGYDPHAPLFLIEPRASSMKFSASLRIAHASLTLLNEGPAVSTEIVGSSDDGLVADAALTDKPEMPPAEELIEIILQQADISFKQLSASLLLNVSLKGAYVFDRRNCMEDSPFKRLLCPGGARRDDCISVRKNDLSTRNSSASIDFGDDDSQHLLHIRAGCVYDEVQDVMDVDIWASLQQLELVASPCFDIVTRLLDNVPGEALTVDSLTLSDMSPRSYTDRSVTNSDPGLASLWLKQLHRYRLKVDVGIQALLMVVPNGNPLVHEVDDFLRMQVSHISVTSPSSPVSTSPPSSSTSYTMELRLHDVSAALLPSGMAHRWHELDTDADVDVEVNMSSATLIDAFDVRVVSQVGAASRRLSKTLRLLLQAEIPPLELRISRSQCASLLRISESFSAPCTKPRRAPKQETTTLSILTPPSMSVEALLTLPIISLNLFGEESGDLLACFSLEGLWIRIRSSELQGRAQLRLRSFIVEDCHQATDSEFRFLATSSSLSSAFNDVSASSTSSVTSSSSSSMWNSSTAEHDVAGDEATSVFVDNNDCTGDSSRSHDLVHISWTQRAPDTSAIEAFDGCDHAIKFDFNALHLNWNPDTVSQLVAFFITERKTVEVESNEIDLLHDPLGDAVQEMSSRDLLKAVSEKLDQGAVRGREQRPINLEGDEEMGTSSYAMDDDDDIDGHVPGRRESVRMQCRVSLVSVSLNTSKECVARAELSDFLLRARAFVVADSTSATLASSSLVSSIMSLTSGDAPSSHSVMSFPGEVANVHIRLENLVLIDMSSKSAPQYTNVLSKRSDQPLLDMWVRRFQPRDVSESDVPVLVRRPSTAGLRRKLSSNSSLSIDDDAEEVPTYPGYDVSVRVELAPLRWVLVPRFVQDLADYVNTAVAFSVFSSNPTSQQPSEVSRVTAALDEVPLLVHYHISVSSVLLLVPRDSTAIASEYLVLGVGRVRFRNEFVLSWEFYELDGEPCAVDYTESSNAVQVPVEQTLLTVSSLRVVHAPIASQNPLLSDVSIRIDSETSVLATSRFTDLVSTKVNGTVSDIEINLHPSDIVLLSVISDEFQRSLDPASFGEVSTTTPSCVANVNFEKISVSLCAPKCYNEPDMPGNGDILPSLPVLSLDVTQAVLRYELQEDASQEFQFSFASLDVCDKDDDAPQFYNKMLSVYQRAQDLEVPDCRIKWWLGVSGSQRVDIACVHLRAVFLPSTFRRVSNLLNYLLGSLPEKEDSHSEVSGDVHERIDDASSLSDGLISFHVKSSIQQAEVWFLEHDELPASMALLGTISANYQSSSHTEIDAMVDVRGLRALLCFRTESLDVKQQTPACVPILRPFNLVLTYTQRSGEDASLHTPVHGLTVHLSMMDLCLSFHDIVASSRIAMSVGPSPSPPHSKLATASLAAASTSATPTPSAPRVRGRIDVLTEGMELVLVNDSPGYYQPLLRFSIPHLTATAEALPRSRRIRGAASITVQAEYHNREVMQWEPLVETWEFQARGQAQVDDECDDDAMLQSDESDEREATVSFSLESDTMMNVNVTETALTNVSLGAECFRSQLISAMALSKTTTSSSSSFRIRNQTGSSLRFRSDSSSPSDSSAIGAWQTLDADEERELDLYQFVRGGDRREWTYACPAVTLMLQGPASSRRHSGQDAWRYWNSVCSVSLDSTAGDALFHPLKKRLSASSPPPSNSTGSSLNLNVMSPSSAASSVASSPSPSTSPSPQSVMTPSLARAIGRETYISTHVRASAKASSVLIVRSPVVVKNELPFTVCIRIVDEGSILYEADVDVGAYTSVPVWLLEQTFKSCLLQVQPILNSTYSFASVISCVELHDLPRFRSRIIGSSRQKIDDDRASDIVAAEMGMQETDSRSPPVVWCNVRATATSGSVVGAFALVLEAPLTITNQLPSSLEYEVFSSHPASPKSEQSDVKLTGSLAPGAILQVYSTSLQNPVRCRLRTSLFGWSDTFHICNEDEAAATPSSSPAPASFRARRSHSRHPSALSPAPSPMISTDELVLAGSPGTTPLRTRLHHDRKSPTMRVSVYVPYWLVNRTGLDLFFSQQFPDGELLLAAGQKASELMVAPAPKHGQRLHVKYTDDDDEYDQQKRNTPDSDHRSSGLPVWADDAPWYTFASARRRAAENRARGLQLLLDRYEHAPRWTPVARSRPEHSCSTMFSFGEQATSSSSGSSSAPSSSSTPSSLLRRLCLRVASSAWSTAFGVDSVGSDGCVSICELEPHSLGASGPVHRMYEFSVHVALSQWPRSKTVTIAPRYVLRNESSLELQYRQEDTLEVESLHPHQEHAVHRFDARRPARLCLRFRECQSQWSGAVALDQVGSVCVRIHARDRPATIVRVQCRLISGTFELAVRDEEGAAPYRIENFTFVTLRFHQYDVEAPPDVVLPYHARAYAWDAPLRRRCLVVDAYTSEEILLAHVGEYALDRIVEHPPVRVRGHDKQMPHSRSLCVSVLADGPVRVLRVLDSMLMAPSLVKTPSSTDATVTTSLRIALRMAGAGLSLIERGPGEDIFAREVAYLSVSNVLAQAAVSDTTRELELSIGSVQLDNQMGPASASSSSLVPSSTPSAAAADNGAWSNSNADEDHLIDDSGGGGVYEVVLAPLPSPNRRPFIEFSVIESLRKGRSDVRFFPYGSLLLQAAELRLDEQFLDPLMTMLTRIQSRVSSASSSSLTSSSSRAVTVFGSPHPTATDDSALPDPPILSLSPLSNTARHQVASQTLYFQTLVIHPIRVDVSYASSSSSSSSMASPNPLRTMVRAVGATIANIEAAPVRFNAVVLRDAFASSDEFRSRLLQRYALQAVREGYKVLGSADLLGNPVALMTSLCAGVVDLFYEPALGLVHSPGAAAQGLVRGAASLLRHSVFGVSNTAAAISTAITKGLTTLVDVDHRLHRRVGLWATAGNLLLLPMHLGVVSGSIRGVAGLTLLPLIAFFDVCAAVSTSVRTLLDRRVRPNRFRAPRAFELGNIVRPYSWFPSVILQFSASRADRVLGFASAVASDAFVVVTNERIVLLSVEIQRHQSFQPIQELMLDSVFSLTRPQPSLIQAEMMDGTIHRLDIGTEPEAREVLKLFKLARRLRRRLRRQHNLQ